MALFRRRRDPASDSAAAIDAFWSAWPDLRGALAESVDSGGSVPAAAGERLTGLVHGVHTALGWEVGAAPPDGGGLADLQASLDADPGELMARLSRLDDPDAGGSGPSYALTLRAGADDDARIAAERWARSAPEDADWVFRPSVPADHQALTRSLTWNGHELDLAHATVDLRADPRTRRLDAGVYHPDFMFLSEEDQAGVAEHVVMLALGEDDHVRTVGTVRPLVEKPLDPLPPASLPSVAQQLRGGAGDGWVALTQRMPLRGPVELRVRLPLERRDFPAFTLQTLITLFYSEADADKLPTGRSAAELEAFTGRIDEVLGTDGARFAQQTSSGQRQLVYYLDPDAGALPRLEEAVAAWSDGEASVSTRLDPEWRIIATILRPFQRRMQS